jgi:RHS repeat-associated protein
LSEEGNKLTSERLRVARKSDSQTLMSCQYDALSRRVVKVSQVPVVRETRYIYDRTSFRLLAELDSTNTLQKSYVWGADISGSQDAAGGIGGLIALTDNTTGRTLQPLYDTMGNVIALTDASGTVTANYRYSAYGELVESSGPDVDVCSLRFSTKYFDAEAGIYYYGYRYLSPTLGRWLSPDPLEYVDGMNVYEAMRENPGSQ